MSALPAPILLVDDEPNLLLIHSTALEEAGFVVATAQDASLALRLVAETDFHVALVDYRLPDSVIDGLELIARLHDAHPLTVVVLMTAYDQGTVGFRAAQAGAFDYLFKPFTGEALLATVRGALVERRRRERMRGRLYVGDLVVDLATRQVTVAGEPVALTDQDFDLLAYLASHARQTVSYDELWKRVWEYDSPPDRGVIHKAISRLREKVGEEQITCSRKKGYCLAEAPAD
jgi:DNA-binding response OmpR family regulator